MNDEEATLKYQEQFGRAYVEDEFVVFNVAVRYPETIVSIKQNPTLSQAHIESPSPTRLHEWR